MIAIGITAILLSLVLVILIYWLRLDQAERKIFAQSLASNSRTLLSLFALASLPAALLLPLPDVVPRGWVVIIELAIWGLFLTLYWSHRVVPAAVLTSSHPTPLSMDYSPFPHALALPSADGDVAKTFRWTFVPRSGVPVKMAIEVMINADRYQTARTEQRRKVGDWAHYAVADMPEPDQLAAEFYRLHQDREWCTLEQASNVLGFTQACITYVSDEETTPGVEWPRYPIETLMDESGDCEDDVILTAAVLKRMGFEIALLYYPEHCALGIAGAEGLPGDYVFDPSTGLKYFYGEATGEGWHLGEVPSAYRGQKPKMIEPVHRVVEE